MIITPPAKAHAGNDKMRHKIKKNEAGDVILFVIFLHLS
jgi:hypothetical protein